MCSDTPEGKPSDSEDFDVWFEKLLDELYGTPLTQEQIDENRRMNPKSAKMVDEIRKIFEGKGER